MDEYQSLSSYAANKQLQILLCCRTDQQQQCKAACAKHITSTTSYGVTELSPQADQGRTQQADKRQKRVQICSQNKTCFARKQTHLYLAPKELKGKQSSRNVGLVYIVEPKSMIRHVSDLRLGQHLADSYGNVRGGGRSCGGCSLRPIVWGHTLA